MDFDDKRFGGIFVSWCLFPNGPYIHGRVVIKGTLENPEIFRETTMLIDKYDPKMNTVSCRQEEEGTYILGPLSDDMIAKLNEKGQTFQEYMTTYMKEHRKPL